MTGPMICSHCGGGMIHVGGKGAVFRYKCIRCGFCRQIKVSRKASPTPMNRPGERRLKWTPRPGKGNN